MSFLARSKQKSQIVRNILLPFDWGNVTKLAIVYFFSTLYFYAPVGTLYLQSRNLNYVQINSLWGIIFEQAHREQEQGHSPIFD